LGCEQSKPPYLKDINRTLTSEPEPPKDVWGLNSVIDERRSSAFGN